MSAEPQLRVNIPRDVKITTYSFTDFFKGFEDVEAVRRIFGEKTEEILRNLQVEFAGFRGYMGVSDVDGHLMVSAYYLKSGDLIDIYLDIIHELVHVKQFMEGKELFDDRYDYVGRPTEIEAYCHAVEEARRLGLDDARICQYLKTEWMSERELKKLTKALNVKYVPPAKR
ncbi:MAG: hypothetical protein ACP5IM_03940 [Candidatus Bathyarchaeia archaeon]